MPQNWKTYKLGEIIEVLTDYHANGSYKKLKENVELLDKPDFAVMIRTKNFEQNDFDQSVKYINEHAYNFLTKSKVFPGDIIMNKIANAGSVYYMPNLKRPVSLAMNLFLIRLNKELSDSFYVYNYLKKKEGYIKKFAAGTAAKTITKDAVRNLNIVLPPLPIQRRIASILGALDDKIELNLEMNKTLEAMAMALYKHWFVDFGPFKHTPNPSQEGNKKSPLEGGASVEAGGVESKDHNTPVFGSGKFIESELGMIPEGWEVKGILEIADLLSGGTPKTSIGEYWNGPIKWVSAKDIGSNGTIYIDSTVKTVTKLGIANSAAKILPEDTVIIVARGSVGKYGMISQEMAMNQSCYGLHSKSNYSQPLIYLTISWLMEHFKRISYGSVFDTITTSTFESTKIVSPPQAIIRLVKSHVDQLFELIKELTIENQTLIVIRDTLLPKLISGEIEVEEAEEEVSKVV